MIISWKKIKKGRKSHICSGCGCSIQIGEPKLELFGAAYDSDPPYTIHLHWNCFEYQSGYSSELREISNQLAEDIFAYSEDKEMV